MKDKRDQSHLAGWAVAYLLFAGFFIWVISKGPLSSLACGTNDVHCFRDWVGALSGWAAAGAAAATIGILIKQVNAQQQQTDFMLGDAEPTIDAVQHVSRQQRVIVRVRNWNRRSMILRKIQLIDYIDPMPQNPMQLEFDSSDKSAIFKFSKHRVVFDKPPLVEGWVKRNEEPSLVKLVITAGVYGPQDSFATNAWRNAKVRIQYEMVGNRAPVSVVIPVHMTTAAIDEPDHIGLEVAE